MSVTTPAFYVTGGTLRQDAPCYVERQADRDLYEDLMHGEFCYVLTSRQMGKSSLMVHTAARLREGGVQVVVLDLTAIGQNLSPEQWYGGLLRRLGRQLDPAGDLEEVLEEFWFAQEERVGPLERWMTALQTIVLPAVRARGQGAGVSKEPAGLTSDPRPLTPGPSLVIFIDEIDAVRSLSFSTDEFFAGIRECYNRRSQDRDYERLTFCLLGVASPSDLIRDTRVTPFNIGRRIELTDFTAAEALPLAMGLVATGPALAQAPSEHEPGPSAERLLQRILYWTGGHPYLTQRLCQAVAEEERGQAADGRRKSDRNEPSSLPSTDYRLPSPADVDRLCEGLFLSAAAREKDDNLLFVRERLLNSEADRASLLDLYAKVRAGQRVGVDDTNPLIDLLRLSGVARLASGRLVVRNRIYERVFDREWITQHMPDAELRRQRQAYRRGLWRAAGVSAAILAVMGGLVVTAMDEARRAEQQRRLAEEGQRALRRSQYADRLNLAQQAVDEGNLQRAQELLVAVRPEPGQEDLRGFEWRYLWRRCQGDALATLDDHRGGVIKLAFSPDGKLLASIGWGHGLRLWDAARRQQIAVFKYPADWVTSVAFSPDGKTLAVSVNGITLWDVASRRQIAVLKGHEVGAGELTFSPDGRLFAAASGADGTVRLWAIGPRPPWRTIATIKGYPKTLGFLPSLVFSPDSKLLVTRTQEGAVRLWDVEGYARAPQTWSKAGPRLVATLGENLEAIICAAFSPDGKTLATGGLDSNVRLWDLATKRPLATLWGHTKPVQAIAFSPDGKTLASCSMDSTVKVWDLASRRELTTLKGHKGAVFDVAFAPDGKLLASGGSDGTVKLWNPAMRAATTDVIRQQAGIYVLAFSPDGRALATGNEDGTVRLWDTAAEREIGALRGHRLRVASLAFSPDGKLLASGSDDHTLKLWDLAHPLRGRGGPAQRGGRSPGRRAIVTQPGFVGGTVELTFSPDSRTLAWQGETAVKLWDVAAKRVAATLPWERGNGSCLAFSPDGRTLAAGNGPGGTTLWDLASRRAAGRLSANANFFFSPDGKMLASTGSNTLKLWDLASRRLLATVRLHADITSGVAAFSPDGRTLALPSGTGVSLINMAARQEAAVLKGHAAAVKWLAFSPDGNTLASGARDGTVRLWHAATFREADSLQVASIAGDRSVTLQWQPLPSAVGYHLYRGPAGTKPTQLARFATLPAAAASFTDRSSILVNGRPQIYAAAAVFPAAGGRLAEGPRVSLQAVPVAVPPGWLGCSLNEGDRSGSVFFQGPAGPILIRGSGWDSPDSLYYLCQPVRGNFRITVRALTRPTAIFPWAKAGLMIRDSLPAGARNGFLLTTPTEGLVFQWNAATNGGEGGSTTVLQDKELKLPIVLRLTRAGDAVTASYSRDGGRQFLPAGAPLAFEEPLPPTVYAGLAITSHNVDLISEARFNDLRVEEPRH